MRNFTNSSIIQRTRSQSIGIPTPGKSNKFSTNHDTSDPRDGMARSSDIISNPSSRIIYWSEETGGFTKSDGSSNHSKKRVSIQPVEETKRPYPHSRRGSLLQQIRSFRVRPTTYQEKEMDTKRLPTKKTWLSTWLMEQADDSQEECSCLLSASCLNIRVK